LWSPAFVLPVARGIDKPYALITRKELPLILVGDYSFMYAYIFLLLTEECMVRIPRCRRLPRFLPKILLIGILTQNLRPLLQALAYKIDGLDASVCLFSLIVITQYEN
jgi:hypothetical protein